MAPIAVILYEHTAPTWVIVGALVAAGLLTLFWFWRYLRITGLSLALAGLRILFVLLLGWCLLRSVRKEESATVIRPRFLVLVDVSGSMNLVPSAVAGPLVGPAAASSGTSSRWATVQQILQQPWPAVLEEKALLEWFTFADDVQPQPSGAATAALEPDGRSTRLHETLTKIVDRYRGQPLGGVLLLSDGLDTRDENPLWAEAAWPVPIYTARLEPPGAWEETPDVRVNRIETPRRVVVGWDSKLTATVSGQGTKGRAINVQLFDGERLVEEQPTQLPAEGGTREAAFTLTHPAVGTFTYRVVVPPLAGELVTNDNVQVASVQVVDTRNRLVYIEGSPRFESKWLKRALQASPNITPLIFLQGRDKKYFTIGQRGSMTTDLTPEQLLQYKIVILGDLDAEAIGTTRAENLIRFVEEGGSLVLLGGPAGWGADGFAATPLTKLMPIRREGFLPVREGRFSTTLTAEGKAHPAFAAQADKWDAAPPILSIFPGARLAPGAVALVQTAEQDPVIAAQRFGQGKVAAILTESLWRWAMEPDQAEAYQRLWTQLLEWLTPAETEQEAYTVDLFTDADQVYLGDPLTLQARVAVATAEPVPPELTVTCEVQTPDERKLTFPMQPQPVRTSGGKTFPGYGLQFTPPLPGLYSAAALTE
ncbi:hypothetical protein HQ590_01720, partial [bacterium]|nr:hypothetical protein [bacterium]